MSIKHNFNKYQKIYGQKTIKMQEFNRRGDFMYSTKRKLLFWSILLVSFSTLLVIATLFDHQISVALALPYLKNGNYMSTNVFGLIFEVII